MSDSVQAFDREEIAWHEEWVSGMDELDTTPITHDVLRFLATIRARDEEIARLQADVAGLKEDLQREEGVYI